MKLITSAQNEQLKHLFRLLTQAKARRESGETVLEGVHLLQTYLQSGGTPKQVYLPEKKQQHIEIQEITAQLDEGLITWVGNEALSKITSLTDADDVMTWIDIPQQAGLPSDGDCVVLERVQDPGNAGTILRSAAAAGVRQIVCSNDSVDIWSPKVLRAG
ncbi:MAG: TrmH family RNA methyltransferase, partial [Neisseria sp.]|nr:TrmH family RNA methyltransferase [Neisseria sp.]